jgi:uncharacterized linocin/CFP29 family protein
MASNYLSREGAPFGSETWERLDGAMLGAARGELSGRRLLEVKGPFGLGLKDIPLADEDLGDGLSVGASLPLTLIHRSFTLPVRDLAAFEHEPSSLNLGPLIAAALAVARAEDGLIFNGTARTAGLLSTEGVTRVKLSAWSKLGAAQGDLIEAASALDRAGFHGPYGLGLSPGRFNQLLRPLETGVVSELDLVKTVAAEGVVKVPALADGGVLIAAGSRFAHLVLGQDMSLGFVGATGDGALEFTVSESLAVRVLVPPAVCVVGETRTVT